MLPLAASLCINLRLQYVFLQEGEFYAHSDAFRFTSLIPKTFQNQSFEAEETAKELTIQADKKIKAAGTAKEVAKKKSAGSEKAKVSDTKQKTHQKPAKDKKTTMEQTTATVPAKEDAPVTITPPTQLARSHGHSIYLFPTRRCTAL